MSDRARRLDRIEQALGADECRHARRVEFCRPSWLDPEERPGAWVCLDCQHWFPPDASPPARRTPPPA